VKVVAVRREEPLAGLDRAAIVRAETVPAASVVATAAETVAIAGEIGETVVVLTAAVLRVRRRSNSRN